jgi:hypothetical protein
MHAFWDAAFEPGPENTPMHLPGIRVFYCSILTVLVDLQHYFSVSGKLLTFR